MNHHHSGIARFKRIVFLFGMFLPVIAVGQNKTRFAVHSQGKIKRSTSIYKFIQHFKAMPDARATSLAKTATKIEDALCSLPGLNPPMGFNAEAGVATYAEKLKDKEPALSVYCYLRYLEKDPHTGTIKTSMDGADLYFDINAFDLFDQIGNYWQDCDKINFPVFFEALTVTDSTADYIQTTVRERTVRLVTTGQPLFIPLTRKEFLQFLIARDTYRIKENQDLINDENKQIAETKKNISDPVYQSVKPTLEKTIATIEEQIRKLNKETGSWREKIGHFHEVLNAMSAKEAAAPARLDYHKKSDELFGLEQLVAPDSREGVLLTRVNPAYYRHSAQAPVAQLITVYYTWPTIGFEKDPDYVQQTALDIFEQLDYHALKTSMQ